jgi:preprotein translocase subunit SecB
VPRKKNLPSKPDGQYSSFLRGIKLVALGMEGCSATLNRGLFWDLDEKKLISRRITADYQLLTVEKNFFNVSAKFKLSVEDKQGTSTALLIECEYTVHFHSAGSAIAKEFAQRFTDSELRLIVWPYFRQFANDITSRMTIPPIVIPLSVTA